MEELPGWSYGALPTAGEGAQRASRGAWGWPRWKLLSDSLCNCVSGLLSGEAFVQEMVPELYGSAGLAAGEAAGATATPKATPSG